MPLEIERKFLVIKEKLTLDVHGEFLCQAYLSEDPARTVRIRITENQAFLTIKGISDGISRKEFEYMIPVNDAKEIIKLSPYPVIEKTRYKIVYSENLWEVDIFHGNNKGLILAEIELRSKDQAIELPGWIGKEVSCDPRYFNSYLTKHPFIRWDENKMV